MARPRSARAHGRVLEAAIRLIAERGIDATSMDAIAEASGVSKATIYKHWPDKDALCLEAMSFLHGVDQPRPDFDSGDVRADLAAVLGYQPPKPHPELATRIMPHLMAYAARNPSFGELWRSCVFDPPRKQLTRLLDRAIEQGLLPRDLDRDFAIALLMGPLFYAHVLKRVHGQAPEDLPQRVVAAFWAAHAIPSKAGNRREPRSKRPARPR